VDWLAGESGAHELSMSVTAPPGTNGSIAVPTYGAANPVVEVGGKVVERRLVHRDHRITI
jgi:alpha-L-rhamnosidase